MIKSQEANKDFKEGDPTKIHWAKFSMMGRFVSITTQCQSQCRNFTDYNFPDSMERRHIRELFTKRAVMSPEVRCFTCIAFYSLPGNLFFPGRCKESASKIPNLLNMVLFRIKTLPSGILRPSVACSFGDHTLFQFNKYHGPFHISPLFLMFILVPKPNFQTTCVPGHLMLSLPVPSTLALEPCIPSYFELSLLGLLV